MKEYKEKADSFNRALTAVRGEFSIASQQIFETDRKVEQILQTLSKIDKKAEKEDLDKTNMRFQDFVPYYEYKKVVESLSKFSEQQDLYFGYEIYILGRVQWEGSRVWKNKYWVW